MPIENATYISQLNPDWPVGKSDFVSGGDDHIRGIKSAVQNTIPNATAPITGTPDQINNITLNTPWIDNSATAGALSNFNLTDPTKDDGTLAALAAGTPTTTQANSNTDLLMTFKLFQQLQYPVGAPFISFTDTRNPVDILGFGTWSAVTGLLAGVGTAKSSADGGSVSFGVGINGRAIVTRANISAETITPTGTVSLDTQGEHVHDLPAYGEGKEAKKYLESSVMGNTGFGGDQPSASAGGHVHNATFSGNAVSLGTAAEGFAPLHYGAYIWVRTA
ncbi:hypothetical protein FDX19_15550 [Citrobacter sp. wls619]|uniref:phage baseplate protein n=1 Tax=Citrobacter sp. wls619 TaxID=2576432 RepID=UPI0010C9B073|nr:hypothetical protein [Citrobacter sp. wls619]TKV08251.1 hypothetical protein FDX19_15550 [Citrobacter sp. wls619]